MVLIPNQQQYSCCDKCKLVDEIIAATHKCPVCSLFLCESHLELHNASKKTMGHADQVIDIHARPVFMCDECLEMKDKKLIDQCLKATHHCHECKKYLCKNHGELHKISSLTKSHLAEIRVIGMGSDVPFSGNFIRVSTLEIDKKTLGSRKTLDVKVSAKRQEVYISYEYGQVAVFDSNTRELKRTLTVKSTPRWMCLCDDDESMIACCGCQVYKINVETGDVLWKFDESRGESNDRFSDHTTCIVDPLDGAVYVADCYNNRVQVISKSGEYLRTIKGEVGSDLAEIYDPYCIELTADGKNLLIFCNKSSQKRGVQLFTKEGVFVNKVFGFENSNLNAFCNPPYYCKTEKCTANLIMSEPYYNKLAVFELSEKEGKLVMASATGSKTHYEDKSIRPFGMDIDPTTGFLYVIDSEERVVIFK